MMLQKNLLVSLDLGLLLIKKYLVKNENRLCFTGKEKEG
jgi:hypothetical protein